MTPYKQLHRHDPDNGVWGDCLRTVIACLFDLRPSEVPHFGEGGPNGTEMNARVDAWLRKMGSHRISVQHMGDLDEVLRSVASQNPEVWYLLTGESRTGVDHVVICRNDAIVHDPSLNGSGIIGPGYNGYYCIEFIGGPQGIALPQ